MACLPHSPQIKNNMFVSSLPDLEIPKYNEIVFNNIKKQKINKKVRLSETSRRQLIQIIQNEQLLLRKKGKDIIKNQTVI
jgi:hypothetical protein